MGHWGWDLLKGAGAIGTTVVAEITSRQMDFEWGMRCASHGVAMLVGLFTIWSIWKKRGKAN